MKNAVNYKNLWLMPNSLAKDLYDAWKKSGKELDHKALDTHLHIVNTVYNKTSGASVNG